MQPIVNGLQDVYNDQVTFVSLDAGDDEEGEAIFNNLGLRGHPAVLIFMADGEEVFRQLGGVDETILIDKLDETLAQ